MSNTDHLVEAARNADLRRAAAALLDGLMDIVGCMDDDGGTRLLLACLADRLDRGLKNERRLH
jgi:hypothetical protein